jgi:hypothetical protein
MIHKEDNGMIHNEDNGELLMKISDEGDLFVYCAECGGVWQTSLNVIRQPKESRPIKYGGTGINLDMGSSEKPSGKKSAGGKTALAKTMFPEAFK